MKKAILAIAALSISCLAAIAQETPPDVSDAAVTTRYVTEDFALDVVAAEGLVVVDWRPRRLSATANTDEAVFALFADIGGVSLTPEATESYSPGTARHIRAVLIDTGAGVTDLEATAFLQHAGQIASFASEALMTALATFSDTVTPVGPADSDAQALMNGLFEILAPSFQPSDPLLAYMTIASELASAPLDRRSVFLLTDAACSVEDTVSIDDLGALHEAFGVPVYVALFAEDAADDGCLDLLVSLASVTGGEVYTIDQTGSAAMQPVFAHQVSSLGGRFVFSYADLQSVSGDASVLTLDAQYLDSALVLGLPVKLEQVPGLQRLVLLWDPYLLHAAILGLLMMAAAAIVALRRRAVSGATDTATPVLAWLGDIGLATAPLPVFAGRTEIGLPDARFTVDFPPDGGAPKVFGGSGLLLNGARIDVAEIRDDDVIETTTGRRFRVTFLAGKPA